LSQGLRCGRAPLGGRGDHRRDADGGCAQERRRDNARVASRCHLARADIRPQKSAPVARADPSDEVAELLDDFLIALFEVPGAWPDLAVALPEELYDRVDRWMDVRSV
jgi:hypothetical protein